MIPLTGDTVYGLENFCTWAFSFGSLASHDDKYY